MANSKVIELKVINDTLRIDMVELKGTIPIQEELDKLKQNIKKLKKENSVKSVISQQDEHKQIKLLKKEND